MQEERDSFEQRMKVRTINDPYCRDDIMMTSSSRCNAGSTEGASGYVGRERASCEQVPLREREKKKSREVCEFHYTLK